MRLSATFGRLSVSALFIAITLGVAWVLFASPLTPTIFAAFLGATILYAAHEVQGSRMTVGDFVLVNTYMLQVVRPVEALGYAMQGLSQGIAMLAKMLTLLRETPEPQLVDDRVHVGGPGKLEFDNVKLSYRPDRSVLRGVSFKIAAGKINAISGKPWKPELDGSERDYIVLPEQPWLDGFCVFSPDGQYLIWASSRAQPEGHEMNLFIAKWVD